MAGFVFLVRVSRGCGECLEPALHVGYAASAKVYVWMARPAERSRKAARHSSFVAAVMPRCSAGKGKCSLS